VDLRYSDSDEEFRSELRSWLEEAVPGHGDPPPAHDWPARRAYDTSWQRKLHEAGYATGLFGKWGLGLSSQPNAVSSGTWASITLMASSSGR